MNILYFCAIDIHAKTASGIFKKIRAQVSLLSQSNNNVFLSFVSGDDFCIVDSEGNTVLLQPLNKKKWIFKTALISKTIKSFTASYGIELVYSRFEDYSLQACRLYHGMKKQKIGVLLEIPTFPISQRWISIQENLRMRYFVKAMKQIYYSTIGTMGVLFLHRCVDRIVTNNGYDRIWHTATIKITNGVDAAHIKPNTKIYHGTEIRMISVANVSAWHGYDKVLAGLKQYYSSPDWKIPVYFDVVGEGSGLQNLKDLTRKLSLDEYVSFWGAKTGVELDLVYERADLGIGILGMGVSGSIKNIDSLKSREYCARSIPFVTGCIEKRYENLAFVYMVSTEIDVLNIFDIIRFFETLNKKENYKEEIRKFAFEQCDWKVAFQNVIAYVAGEDK